MPESDEIGVAVIGLGFVGGKAHAPSFAKIPSSKLVAICDKNRHTATRILEKYKPKYYASYRDAIIDPDVEAVVVATPTPYHYEISSYAIESGKHVLCEMPLTATIEEAYNLERQAKKADILLMPVLNFRFTPNYVKAKELIDQRKMGKPVAFSFQEMIPVKELVKQWPTGCWAWDVGRSGGYPNYTLSVWSIDLIRWLLNTEISEVSWKSNFVSIEGYDNVKGYQTLGVVELVNGVVGMFHYGTTSAEESRSILEVFGNNETELTANSNDTLRLGGKERQEWSFNVKGPRVWGHYQNDAYFIDCILRRKKPSFGAGDAIQAMSVAKQMVDTKVRQGE